MVLRWLKKRKKAEKETGDAPNGEASTESAETASPEPDNEPAAEAPQPAEAETVPPGAPEPQVPERGEPDQAGEAPAPGGFFSRLKKGMARTRDILNTDIDELFAGGRALDDDLLEELEELLITADVGVRTSMDLLEKISRRSSKIKTAAQFKSALKEEILGILDLSPAPDAPARSGPRVVMVVGVNGVGKTTTIGKLAARAGAAGQKVLIGAADTFRAAAIEQLGIWADRAGADLVKHRDNADPAAVAYDSVEAAVARNADLVLIDTAGRLHTKVNLMEELKKIRRTIAKVLPDAPHDILLVLDATTGQNALTQAEMFNKTMGINGIALTKLDGTARGGIAIGICNSLGVPLKYIGVGEAIDDLQDFDPTRFVDAMLG
jgi:fused signal recognition particle receptor